MEQDMGALPGCILVGFPRAAVSVCGPLVWIAYPFREWVSGTRTKIGAPMPQPKPVLHDAILVTNAREPDVLQFVGQLGRITRICPPDRISNIEVTLLCGRKFWFYEAEFQVL